MLGNRAWHAAPSHVKLLELQILPLPSQHRADEREQHWHQDLPTAARADQSEGFFFPSLAVLIAVDLTPNPDGV